MNCKLDIKGREKVVECARTTATTRNRIKSNERILYDASFETFNI